VKKDADKGRTKDKGLSTVTARSRRRRMVQYLVVFVGCVLVIDSLVGDKGVLQMMKKRQDFLALTHRLAALKAENARLFEEAQRIKYDEKTLEEIARRDLGLIKPGEKLYIIKDAPPAGTRPDSK
jgi:cell division protein FtsB/cell division protein DivIC